MPPPVALRAPTSPKFAQARMGEVPGRFAGVRVSSRGQGSGIRIRIRTRVRVRVRVRIRVALALGFAIDSLCAQKRWGESRSQVAAEGSD